MNQLEMILTAQKTEVGVALSWLIDNPNATAVDVMNYLYTRLGQLEIETQKAGEQTDEQD